MDWLKDDMDWLKDEIRDIKTCIVEIAEHLKGDVDLKLEPGGDH